MMLDQIPFIGGALDALLPFLLVLGVVVFIHEMGHYLVGRWCGIGAEAFSIGFGPELLGWTDRRGTRWRVGALPLGGYVKFVGDGDAASATARAMSEEERGPSLDGAPLPARAATVAAGPVANFLLSILIFAGVALYVGAADEAPVIGEIAADANIELTEALRAGDVILEIDGAPVAKFSDIALALAGAEDRQIAFRLKRDGREMEVETVLRPPARIDALSPGGAAEKAGLKPGDVIVAVDGEALESFSALQKLVRESRGREMALTVRRGEERIESALTPQMTARTDPVTGEVRDQPMLGVVKLAGEIAPRARAVGPVEALGIGVERSWAIVAGTVDAVTGLVSGAPEARDSVGGPIRIAQISGQAADAGAGSLLVLIAVLSTSIGLLNLLPIPVLDGGHLLFMAVEAVTGRPPAGKWREIATGLGLALVLSLMIFATYNDLSNL